MLLAGCAPGSGGLKPGELSSSERYVQERIDRIPIVATPISPAAREEMRRAGRPVMTVSARAAYLYRDAQHPSELDERPYRRQQDVPDVQGCVVVSFDVRSDGKTDGYEIEQSTPPGVFDKAAVRAIFATQYEPATTPWPRQRHALWFLVARPPRAEVSVLSETIEDARNREREAQRANCEGQTP